MVRNNTWTGLGRKIMDSDSDKRHYLQDVVAKCNFELSPICESWVTLGGATHTIVFV